MLRGPNVLILAGKVDAPPPQGWTCGTIPVRVLQSRADPPLEIVWFYSAVRYASGRRGFWVGFLRSGTSSTPAARSLLSLLRWVKEHQAAGSFCVRAVPGL
ncbi:hypothetical protein Taro_037312 [Colocasia esculenta]|uniref:Uncharacterized protein n=1 Tax=Colocasia esculenta TaxID=4460 RepID=A0A843WPB2_COLES|nr:hypothetical protein [Colocasia esculenta]